MTGEQKVFTLKPALLQIQSLNPFADGVSASRADMFGSEIGQAPPLSCSETKLIQTGMEREYGKYTSKVKIPVNAIIVKVINHYPPTGFTGGGVPTPTTIIYQNMDDLTDAKGSQTPKFNMVHIPVNSLNHHVLGFDFVRTKAISSIRVGAAIPADTILARSPSIDENGDYKFGVNANILLGSFPEVRQDGVVFRRGFANKIKFKGYGEMTVSFGEDEIPLNLYGDDKTYKIHPDIGERIRPDGVMFATRKLIHGLEPVQMSRKALRTFYTDTDSGKIVKELDGDPVVIKVEVFHNPKGRPATPTGMDEQPRKYLESQRRYYKDLKDAHYEIRRMSNGNYELEPELHNALVYAEAMLYDSSKGNQKINFVDGGAPLAEYTIKITYSYNHTPFDGHKMADLNGGKGVLVELWDDDRMPVDADGNVADIIMDGASIVNRLNPSRTYEIDINASFARTRKRIIESVTADPSPANIKRNFDWLCDAYEIISPRFAALARMRDPAKHIAAVVKEEIRLWMPTDNPIQKDLAVEELLTKYPKCYGPILITKDDGTKVWSKSFGTIGKQYIIILEKTGDEYSAVSVPVLQSHGIPGKLTKADKQSSPGRPQATRITGETEGRLLNALVNHDALFELLDIANSPTTLRAVCRTLLTHPTPSNIERVIDREQYPRGNNRIVRIGNDGLFAAGFMYNYRKVED